LRPSTADGPGRRTRPASPAAERTVILGIDPGTLVTGYGVIELSGGTTRLVASGMVRNSSGRPMPERLKLIHESLVRIVRKYRPDQAAVETAFYGKNAQSALKLGQARGVAILAAVAGGVPLAEYSPREIKKAVVGNGNASKQQVQYMIRSLLGMTGAPAAYDVTDALAVAVCHGHRTAGGGKRYSDWGAYLRENPGKLHQRAAVK
jgi:crossover junction endodeoxyribonuclease RuvC